GGAAALCLVAGVVLVVAVAGKNRSHAKDDLSAGPGSSPEKAERAATDQVAAIPAPVVPADQAATANNTDLPKDGPGDPSLTYEVVRKDPVAYRGKRVTWPAFPVSATNAVMLSAANP